MNEAGLLQCGLRAAQALVAGDCFEMGLAEALLRQVGADCVSVNVWRDWRRQPAQLFMAGHPRSLPLEEVTAWQVQFGEHPYFAHVMAFGDPRPYRTSDLMPFRKFCDTAVYRSLLGPYDLRHQLVMTVQLTDQDRVFIGLCRSLRDFSDRDSGALEPLRAVLAAAFAYQTEVRAVQRLIAARLPQAGRHVTLTRREDDVLALVAAGFTNDQAARRLGISSRTVRKHLENVFTKAKVSSRAAAAAWWIRRRPR